MNEFQKGEKNSSHSKNISNENKTSFHEQDNDDIIKQLSQITPDDDKSFESSLMMTRNFPKFYDYKYDTNRLSKDSNIFPSNFPQDSINKENFNEENPTPNNQYFLLNQKLKYICSLIQISNINIMKYDDLNQFNSYLKDKNLIINHHKPINLLFDIINELIFVIQKELKNNNILMKEIKRLKYYKNDGEKIIYKLKYSIKQKDEELNQLKSIKNDKFYRYNLNEIETLKQENKELYKKINIYKTQIKKAESINNIILNNFNSVRKEKLRKSKISNKLYNYRNIPNISSLDNLSKLNNSYDDSKCKISKKNLTQQNTNFDFYRNTNNYKTLYITNSETSPIKIISQKLLNNNTINYIINNSNNNNKNLTKKDEKYNINNSNESSIVSNMRLLLKDINNMLKLYSSSLNNLNLNNKKSIIEDSNTLNSNIEKDKNIKKILNFIDKIEIKIKKIEDCLKKYNENKRANSRKCILVNTSRWKFKKKIHNKEKVKKENNNLKVKADSLSSPKNNIYV